MKQRNVLITGGAGFIGIHLCKLLIKKKYNVSVIDNFSIGKIRNIPKNVNIYKKDILDYNSCVVACKNIDVVIHLAAKVSIRNSVKTFNEDVHNNVIGTVNILNAAAKTKVKKIILASSMAVYEKSNKKNAFKEKDSLEPLSPYGVSKLASEKYILLMAPRMGIDPIVLRLFNTFGPGQTLTPYVGVITIFIKNILNNKISRIFGNGNQKRDFVYVDDVAKGFLLAMESNKSVNKIFNIGSGKTISIKKIFKIIKEKIGKGDYKYYPRDDTELNYVCADISKAKKLISFKPQHTFESKIKEVIDQLKSTT
jgi:UDP-glucose 4-epimerase|tara:strand:+ start:3390 stop:4319 length:930 start_codon:yes stop_codon:yes gene_type:complete